MSVGVMKDYKLKLRNLRASHTLGDILGEMHSFFFFPPNGPQVEITFAEKQK